MSVVFVGKERGHCLHHEQSAKDIVNIFENILNSK